ADELINSKFDTKYVLRLMLLSSTYERSSLPTNDNREDKTLFSHQPLRRMSAEQLYDSILVATGQKEVGAPVEVSSAAPKSPAPGPKRMARDPAADGPAPWAFEIP